MKGILGFLLEVFMISSAMAAASLEKVDVKILDETIGKCTIKINPGN